MIDNFVNDLAFILLQKILTSKFWYDYTHLLLTWSAFKLIAVHFVNDMTFILPTGDKKW